MEISRPYGVAATVVFPLISKAARPSYLSGALASPSVTAYVIDAAAPQTVTAISLSAPVHIAGGQWRLDLSASQMSHQHLAIHIVDSNCDDQTILMTTLEAKLLADMTESITELGAPLSAQETRDAMELTSNGKLGIDSQLEAIALSSVNTDSLVNGVGLKIDAVAVDTAAIETYCQEILQKIADAGITIPASIAEQIERWLFVQPISEISAGAPPMNPSISEAVMFLYMALRYKKKQTSSVTTLHNSAGNPICKAPFADDGTTVTSEKFVAP